MTQSHSDASQSTPSGGLEPLGGTTWGARFLFGVQMTPRLALEFEPSISGEYSWEYSYRPIPTGTADVVASRRDTLFSFQLRTRAGIIEPVAGLGYVRGSVSRHATIGGATYFDDSGTDNGFALVAGMDVRLKVAPHLYVVPTFRLFVVGGASNSGPLGADTNTGVFAFRYGVGARAVF